MRSILTLFTAATLLLCAACGHKEPTAEAAPGKHYVLTGKVVSLNEKEHTAKIAGDAVPGWMDAMTMDYPVAPGKAWEALHPNQAIRATLDVQGTDYKIVEVTPASQVRP